MQPAAVAMMATLLLLLIPTQRRRRGPVWLPHRLPSPCCTSATHTASTAPSTAHSRCCPPTFSSTLGTGRTKGRGPEHADFDDWISTIKSRYRYVVLIGGNHEWKKGDPRAAARPKESILEQLPFIYADPSCFLLDHESITLLGLHIFGSAWVPRSKGRDPDQPGPHKFHLIPDAGVDVLLTHGPPAGIFDKLENTDQTWGSSRELHRKVLTARPGCHLFGHIHEQRGAWHRPSEDDDWRGGCAYELSPGSGVPIATGPPPARSHPGTLIANNAMKNHRKLETSVVRRRVPSRIAGGGLLIAATPDGRDRWTFSLL